VVDPVRFDNRPAALAGFEPVDGFPLLMIELRSAPELGAALDGGDAPLVGTPQDACALSSARPDSSA
jgi:hypothetical protein